VRVLDAVATSSVQQKALRAVALAAPLAFLVLVPLAGGVHHPVFTAVGVGLAVVVALFPESHAPLGVVLYLALLWTVSLPGAMDGWTLVAAADLLVLHLACTLLSYGPPGLTLDPVLLALWRGRAVLCLAGAVLVWLGAVSVRLLDLPRSATGLGLALLLLLGWVTVLSLRLRAPRDH